MCTPAPLLHTNSCQQEKVSYQTQAFHKSFLFGCDKENIEPEVVCQPCTRILDQIHKAYVTDQKNQNSSDEENVKEKVADAEKILGSV